MPFKCANVKMPRLVEWC